MIRFCIILGAMKSGTTSLFRYLAQHPQIAPCREKEPAFFSHDYEKGYDGYLSLWNKKDISNKILLEASTNYTKYPSFSVSSENMLDFLKKYDVSLQLIYIMRNPFDRIESQYTHSYARYTQKSMEERLDPHGHLMNVSRYAMQLDQYYKKFDAKNILLLDFDQLLKDPQALLQKVCRFLEIDTDFEFSSLDMAHNISQGTVVTRPIHVLYKKYPFMKLLGKCLPSGLKNWIRKYILRKKIMTPFTLTKKQRQKVHEALRKDMTRLHKKYGVDVSRWGF